MHGLIFCKQTEAVIMSTVAKFDADKDIQTNHLARNSAVGDKKFGSISQFCCSLLPPYAVHQ